MSIESATAVRILFRSILVVIATIINAQVMGTPGVAATNASRQAQTADLGPTRMGGAEARAAVSQLIGEELLAKLESLLPVLSPTEAPTIARECAARLEGGLKARAYLLSADLFLLGGDYAQAADAYSAAAEAGGGDQNLLLRAARSKIAAGETEPARQITSRILAKPIDAMASRQALLVGAWALLIQGDRIEARALALDVAETGAVADRREALLLLWLTAEDADKAAAASKLAKAFPGSTEALLASGTLLPAALPHWYLCGLVGGFESAVRPRGPVPDFSASAKVPSQPDPKPVPQIVSEPEQPPQSSADQSQGNSQPSGLQVGYFSIEQNAKSLQSELSRKGFTARVEKRVVSGAQPRWVVIVEAGKNSEQTRLKLKDAGYESYPVY